MKLIAIILHLTNGEIATIPVTLKLSEVTCHNALSIVIDKNENQDILQYKGVEILGYYCKNNKGDWIS